MKKTNKLFQKFRITGGRNLALQLVVVFLGVTGGFLLNSWRITNQEQKLEEKYISAFLHDVESNMDELDTYIKRDSIWLQKVRPTLISIKDRELSVDSAVQVMLEITQISRAEMRTGTYKEITNSGNFNIIEDFQLKSHLVDYDLEIKGVGFIDDYFYQYFNDMVMPFVFSEFSVLWIEFKNEEVVNSIEFSNVVAGYYSMIQQRLTAYKKLKEKSISLKSELADWMKQVDN